MTFQPPSVAGSYAETSRTFLSEVPEAIKKNKDEECVLGVDEAGRGPVLGSMVYGISYCLKTYEAELKKYGFADSKTLTDAKRRELLEEVCTEGTELYQNIGWSTRTMTAGDISSGMLRHGSVGTYNLNEQAHDATMDLIQGVLEQGVHVTEIYVDTVGPPVSYQAKLQTRFPQCKVTVTKKADALFPCVSCASICAKVTRDIELAECKKMYSEGAGEIEWGSGYPSDPKTVRWLRESVDPVFGWRPVVRFSWQTSRECLKNNGGVAMEFGDEVDTQFAGAGLQFGQRGLLETWYGGASDAFV